MIFLYMEYEMKWTLYLQSAWTLD